MGKYSHTCPISYFIKLHSHVELYWMGHYHARDNISLPFKEYFPWGENQRFFVKTGIMWDVMVCPKAVIAGFSMSLINFNQQRG